MRLPLITGWLTVCHTHSLSLNAQMHRASVSINRTQACRVYMCVHTWTALTGTYHTATSVPLCSCCKCREKRQIEEFDKWWHYCFDGRCRDWDQVIVPGNADTLCGVRDITGGKGVGGGWGLEPETRSREATWQICFQTGLPVKKMKNWQIAKAATASFLRFT